MEVSVIKENFVFILHYVHCIHGEISVVDIVCKAGLLNNKNGRCVWSEHIMFELRLWLVWARIATAMSPL